MGVPSEGKRAALVLLALCAACCLHGSGADHQPGAPFHRRRRSFVPGFTVRIGGTLGLTGRYRVPSVQAYQGLMLFEEVANNNTLFKTSSGEPIFVSFDLRNDMSSESEVKRVYKEMVDSMMYDAFVGPYSSEHSLEAASITNQSGDLIVLHQASSPEVYTQGLQRVFSTNVMATDYTADALRLLYERGARTVALAQGVSLFHRAICDGARYHAARLGYEVVSEVSIADSDITSGIKQSARSSPDVFVGCGHLHNAIQVTVTSKALMFNPKAMIIVQAASADYVEVVQAPNANYILGPVTWDKSLPQGCDIFGSAARFHDLYVSRWNMEPTYHAAQAAAAGIVLMSSFAIFDFPATPDMVAFGLRADPFHTLIGDLNFSTVTGTSYGGVGLAKQFKPTEGNATAMQRYQSLQSVLVRDANDLVYPMPSWEKKELEIYPCPLGYVLSEASQGSSCTICPVGYYRNKASLICRRCPHGTYGLEPGLDECLQCSQGMDCEGVRQTRQLLSVQGFYLIQSEDGLERSAFMSCSPPEACLAANVCSSMQQGFLCSQCREGYTNLGPWSAGTGMCHKCPDPIWELVGFLALILMSQVIFLIVLHSHAHTSAALTSLHTVILRILMNYFTFVAAFIASVKELELEKHLGFRIILALFVDPLSHFFSLDCLLSLSRQRPFQVIIIVGILLVPTLLINSFLAILLRDLIPLLYRNALEQTGRVLAPEGDDLEEPVRQRSLRLQEEPDKPSARRVDWRKQASDGSLRGPRRSTSFGVSETSSVHGEGDDSQKNIVDGMSEKECAALFEEEDGEDGSSGKVQLHGLDRPAKVTSRLQRLDHLLDHVKQRFVRRAVIWVFLIYPIIVHMLLQGAICVKKDTFRLRSSLDIVCQGAEHTQWFRLCVFGLMMYGIGLPSLLFFQLFRVRHQLMDLNVRQNLGFLYNGFEPRYYYFEVINMVRKLAVLSALAVPYDDIRLLIMLGIGLVFMGLHIRCEPYDDRDFFVLDRLETLSLAAFLFSCLAGLWFDFTRSISSTSTTHFGAVLKSQVVDWLIICMIICAHAAFLVLAIWSLLRNLLLKHLRFLAECFPERLSSVQRCLLRLAEKQWHHIRMDPDTHELDISQLSNDERRFLYAALCDTTAAYIAAAVRLGAVPSADANKDKGTQDGQKVPTEPDSRNFYIGFMVAALRRAYKRVEYSRYKRAVHYLQALEEELEREQDGWWLTRKLRCVQRSARNMMLSSQMEAERSTMSLRTDSDPTKSERSESANMFRSALAWLKRSHSTRSGTNMCRGTAEQRAAVSIRKIGVTVEELHLALMLSWPDIAAGKEEYFVLETDEDRERAFRREVLRAEGTTWREDESVKKLFKSLELRRHLKPCAVEAAGPQPSTPPPETDEDGPAVEELLGLQPAALEQASHRALRQEHEELLVEVLELRNKVRSLERRLQATGEQALSPEPESTEDPLDAESRARESEAPVAAELDPLAEREGSESPPAASGQQERADGAGAAAGPPSAAAPGPDAEPSAQGEQAEPPPAAPSNDLPPAIPPAEEPPVASQASASSAQSEGAAPAGPPAHEVGQQSHLPVDNALPMSRPHGLGDRDGCVVQI